MVLVGCLAFLKLLSAASASLNTSSSTFACGDLTTVNSIPNVNVVNTIHYTTGQLNLSTLTGSAPLLSPAVNNLPFCRLIGSYNHTGSSNETGSIGFELWLPDQPFWNRRYLGVGGGGFVGSVDVSGFGSPLNQGFAVAGTDSGHRFNSSFSSGSGVFIAYQHSKLQLTDWIHDSNHYTAVASKALMGIYYGREPEHNYFTGCSTGGGQAMALAQLWPEDFDGIHAGCPGSYYSGLMMALTWAARALKTGNGGGNPADFPQSVLNLTYAAVLEACDALDGLKDGLISAPLNCSFDPAVLACNSSSSNETCLTAAQLETVQTFYSGAVDPVTQQQIYSGFVLGSEREWVVEAAVYDTYATAIFQNTWANNLSYDPLDDFDFHGDLQKVHDGLGVFIDANSTDLSAFHARGGKLIVSQSLADNINPQKYPSDYYAQVKTAMDIELDPWFRLFHVPGAQHCGGGPGPNFFDPVPQLIEWVEASVAPERIIASKFNGDEFAGGLNRSMPLCPWPKIALYVSGDVNVESSFDCR